MNHNKVVAAVALDIDGANEFAYKVTGPEVMETTFQSTAFTFCPFLLVEWWDIFTVYRFTRIFWLAPDPTVDDRVEGPQGREAQPGRSIDRGDVRGSVDESKVE